MNVLINGLKNMVSKTSSKKSAGMKKSTNSILDYQLLRMTKLGQSGVSEDIQGIDK